MTCAYLHDHTDGLCTDAPVFVRVRDWYHGLRITVIHGKAWATVTGW